MAKHGLLIRGERGPMGVAAPTLSSPAWSEEVWANSYNGVAAQAEQQL